MRHFIAYHNPEKMGYQYTVSSDKQEYILTNKPVKHVIGNTVWVVTFEAEHDYSLASVFVVSSADEWNEAGFKHRISGRGHSFYPWKRIKHLSWFAKLMTATGNFGLGLQEVSDAVVVKGLVAIAEKDGYEIENG